MVTDYAKNVFINCPLDEEYSPILDAIIFAIYSCGFIPQCALKEDNSGHTRFDKIKHLIAISKFGVHDISRTEPDEINLMPRFNMPLELGVFIGAATYGNPEQRRKNSLILDKEPYRYQVSVSDIAGQDIRSHANEPAMVITHIRNWLNAASDHMTIPGGAAVNKQYREFQSELPGMCRGLQMTIQEATYNDYTTFVSDWLLENPVKR